MGKIEEEEMIQQRLRDLGYGEEKEKKEGFWNKQVVRLNEGKTLYSILAFGALLVVAYKDYLASITNLSFLQLFIIFVPLSIFVTWLFGFLSMGREDNSFRGRREDFIFRRIPYFQEAEFQRKDILRLLNADTDD
jgi:hypothetical protein